MTQFLNCNNPNIISELKVLGLNEGAIFEIFFGVDNGARFVEPFLGVHPIIIQTVRGEMLSSEPTFHSIRNRHFRAPNIWTGETLATDIGFATPCPPEVRIPTFPLFYHFDTPEGLDFWLVSFSFRSVITQIIIPSMDLVLSVIDPNSTQIIWNVFREYESRFKKALSSHPPGNCKRTIGLVDQLPNYAHQLINHLSGIERLMENGAADCLDEIWIVGVEFFGKIESFYPSLATKIRRFSSRDQVSDLLLTGNSMPYHLGCSVFRSRLRSQIMKKAADCYKVKPKSDRFPVVAVTLREQGRRCVNLETVISRIMSRLGSKYPKLAFVLDGWVRPEGDSNENELTLNTYSDNVEEIIDREQRMAERIVQELSQNTVIRNLIGRPMLQSILGIADIDLYLSHIGTLQHKIGFFSCRPGVVHGPTASMTNPAPTALQYFSEIGEIPILLPENAILDGPNMNPSRGPAFCDYELIDPDLVVDLLEKLLAVGNT